MTERDVAIIGPGRMGRGLASALVAGGHVVTLLGRVPRAAAPRVVGPRERWADALSASAVVVIATPDSAIADVAVGLAADGAVDGRHVVLHLSGLLDRAALAALVDTGAGLGSLHPLQTIADPAFAVERLRGAYAGIEGDRRAITAAESLARSAGMIPVAIPEGGKVLYHLGATFVANYAASLLALGQAFAEQAGISADAAEQLYRPLLAGAAANLVALGPVSALTGAVRRGDVATIAAHLSRLDGLERRLYCDLGLVALGLAERGGLAPPLAEQVRGLLGGG